MPSHTIYPLPKLHHLPASLPLDGAVLHASTAVQRRITALLRKQQETILDAL